MTPARERLMRKVVVDAAGCWIWTGCLDGHGYGQIQRGGRSSGRAATHRLSYELHVGPIPDGLQIDHLCRVPACCNPAHLEAVTQRENILRGSSHAAQNALKTHCKHGHEFTPENTYCRKDRTPSRDCRACHAASERSRAARAKKAS